MEDHRGRMFQPGECFYAIDHSSLIVWQVNEINGPATIVKSPYWPSYEGSVTASIGPWCENDGGYLHLFDDTARLRLRLDGKL